MIWWWLSGWAAIGVGLVLAWCALIELLRLRNRNRR